MQRPGRLPYKTENAALFSANGLKLIAITAMTLDHVAWTFFPLNSIWAQLFHFLGRLTAPIMSFLIAEGYHHTRDVKKYALRLFLLAIISHFAFQYYSTGHWPLEWIEGKLQFFLFTQTSVIYTLLLGLIALILYQSGKTSTDDPFPLVLLCIFSLFGDWMFFVVLWIYYFGVYREDEAKKFRAFAIVGLSSFVLVNLAFITSKGGRGWEQVYQIGVLLAWPLLKNYKQGLGRGGKTAKYLFYAYYPLHLVVIRYVAYLLGK